MKKKEIRILWTGGWDSTYRMIELSMKPVVIHPVYVNDPNRMSKEYELRAMNSILDALKEKTETIATIIPVEIINLCDIPEDHNITKAFKIIQQETHLGIQHEWLARLGKTMQGVEMGTEAGSPETSHIIAAIEKYGKLRYDNNIGYLDPELSTEEGMLVLGWFRFPIIKLHESEMEQNIKKWKYEDVVRKIWFCHTPIEGKPCGFCHPCCVKMVSKMEWLLPVEAQKRYKWYMFTVKLLGERVSNGIFQHIYL